MLTVVIPGFNKNCLEVKDEQTLSSNFTQMFGPFANSMFCLKQVRISTSVALNYLSISLCDY